MKDRFEIRIFIDFKTRIDHDLNTITYPLTDNGIYSISSCIKDNIDSTDFIEIGLALYLIEQDGTSTFLKRGTRKELENLLKQLTCQ